MNETISFLVHVTGQGKIAVRQHGCDGTNSCDHIVLYGAF
jgi:hypothetical protein